MLRRLFGVKCYSVKTKKVFYLFKSELTAQYIRANFTNSPIGLAWVLADELTPSEEIKHPPLDPGQKKMVREIMSNLKGVYDLSFDEWELGFRKDQDINLNIAQFGFISGRFKSIQDSLILDQQEKADLFRMMMAVMNNGEEFAIHNVTYGGQIERNKTELVRKFMCAEKDLT
jgi:hypothetical protein